MESLRSYVLSIICTAIICTVASEVMKSFSARKYIQLLSGLFLAVTIVKPLVSVDISQLVISPEQYHQDASAIAEEGIQINRNAVAAIIKSETEAYILDKAKELGADIQTDIRISEDEPYIPVGAEITGKASPYVQRKLESILQSQMGIPKENQQWIMQE